MNNGRKAPSPPKILLVFLFFFSKTFKRMKAIIVTTATMIVNIHRMENKLTSIYNVKTKSSMQAKQHTTKTIGSNSLCYLAQRNRSEAMGVTCVCVCVCLCI